MSAANAAVLSADSYDQPKAREYQEIMDVINRRGAHGEDVYGDLVGKETRVLDTVDRVVNDARLQASREKNFLNLSLTDIGKNLASTLHELYVDLSRAKTLQHASAALTAPHRRVYMGLTLVLLAFTLLAIQASS